MKKTVTFFFTLLVFSLTKVSSQNIFKTGSGNITIPGDLVYSAFENDIRGGNVWAQGYAGIKGDSVSYTKVIYTSDKSTAYYCYQYIACLKDIFMPDSVSTLDDPSIGRLVHLISALGKAKDKKRLQAVSCNEYSASDYGAVRTHKDYSILFAYNERKAADTFYKQLVALIGEEEQQH